MDKFKQFLKKISPITETEFAETISYFTELNLQKGDYFVKQDKICKHIGFIISGTIRIYYINSKGEETTYGFCQENCLTTSFKSFLSQTPSHLVLQALENTRLLTIDYEHLNLLYKKYPTWQNIGRIITQNEFLIMEQYASVLNNETAKEKYLRLLKEQPNVLQKASIEDIASYLGVTRRTLSRIRQEISK
ncbi:MAG: Crp/Fnr family transcriptional regulator [Saprospiraceae bacterium]|nr:Crp/Fnr family transcriptional regulator [Saprospiraceae bacterium]MBK9567031.1 Crp/Fnr family transcriptional regulator [Saprospiraceae bacterium]MBP6446650.1 Crp/Fnr family transcriptional regulator [Saprospiraceae bacterium]